ncbi:MAG: hypothetical protein E7450_00595 [Ruminococcaceae bacterium]|nr:hypothetical protein [Oscillospiraceae bacterium]
MTEREKIRKTYAKIKKKHPDVVDRQELVALAIKQEKRSFLLSGLGFLILAILAFAGVVGLSFLSFGSVKGMVFTAGQYGLLFMGIFAVAKSFQDLGMWLRVETTYRPAEVVIPKGVLTRQRILKDGYSALKQEGMRFVLVKVPLFDKEASVEFGKFRFPVYKYSLLFRVKKWWVAAKVRKLVYADAALGAMYYVVLTMSYKMVGAYQASNWELDEELAALCEQLPEEEAKPEQEPERLLVEPPVRVVRTKEKMELVMPIAAMVLMLASCFTAGILTIPALVVAIIALVRQRSWLSITSMIIAGAGFLLNVLSFVMVFIMLRG